MLSYDQKVARQQGIGASDIGAILGINPYKTALDVYLDKINPIPDVDPLQANDAIIFGNLLEPVIIQRYEQVTGEKILSSPMISHPKYPFIKCSPDGLIMGKQKGIECKTARHPWGDVIPQQYFMQVAHTLFTLDYESYDLVCLASGQDFRIYTVERDKDFDKIILEACSKFWHEHIEKQIPPDVDYSHGTTLDVLKKIYNKIEDIEINLPAELDSWVDTWISAKEEVKKYNQVAQTAQAHLLVEMKNANVGIMNNGAKLIRKEVKVKGYEVKPSNYVTLSYKVAK